MVCTFRTPPRKSRSRARRRGPGRMNDDGERIPMEVGTGDRVLYGKYAGTEVSLDGDDYLIVKESDVLAVL